MKTKRQREKANKTVYASSKKRTEDHNSGFAPTAFKVPEGCRAFKFKKAGKYRIDVMPFIVGKGNPFADPGVAHYERTFWVHKSVGPEQNSYCCLRKCFNKPCPICEHTAKLRRNPSVDIKAVKEMEPKERQLFVFKDLTDTEYDGYYVYEGSHFKGFGEILDAKVKASEDDDNFENFFHLEDGMTLRVLTEEDRFNGRTFYKPTNLDMLPRKEQYDESILAEIPCLDECLIEKSYKELKKLFDQGGADEGGDDSDDEELKKLFDQGGADEGGDDDEEVAEVEDDEDTEEEDETDVFNKGDEVTFVTSKGKTRTGTITKINDKKKLAHVKVEGQETDSVVDLADLKLAEEEEDTDEEEDLPVKKVKKDKPKKKAEDEDDDDQEEVSEEDSEDASDDDDESDSDAEDDDEPDEEEDAEEEEPVKPAKKKKKAPEPEEDEDADVDWDADDEPEEEDEEEEEPAPKKKKKK